mgnify:CR=1 FL=1
MQKPLKILVVRFSSIGDIVLTSPVVRCLKKQLNAEVHFITKYSFKSVVEHNPNIDKIYSYFDSEPSYKNNILIKLPEKNFFKALNFANKIIYNNKFNSNKVIDLRISNHMIISNE